LTERGIHARILEYQETQHIFHFLPGSYYVFESRQDGGAWQAVLEFREDDRISIPIDQVRIFAPGKATFYIGWTMAVTLDGGKTWHVWDAKKDLPGWACCNYSLIRSVIVNVDGTGEMTLHPIRDRAGEIPSLYTTDFGIRWTPERPSKPN
jgi:hypothetical protein